METREGSLIRQGRYTELTISRGNQVQLIIARCISNDTLVRTINGERKIGKIPDNSEIDILSYNLKEKRLEQDKAIKINSGYKEVFEVQTKYGKKIKASLDHIFFIYENDKIIEKRLLDLKIGDKILVD